MENTFDHIDDIIGKYLAGEASAEETAWVNAWLSKSESNKKHFEHCRLIFDQAADHPWQQFDADAAWNKVRAKLHGQPAAKVVSLQERSPKNLFLKIAAGIVVLLGIGLFAYEMLTTDSKPVEVITEKKPATDTLPDGSDVVLNRETRLTYAFDKKKNAHVVKLKGEAYFNIKHNDNKTFIVDVEGVYVKDIGTSFNVKGYPDSNTIEVVVEEGEVMFYTDKDSGVYLRENGKGIYNKATKTFTVEDPEPNVAAYKTKFFIFSNTDLGTVVETLNNVYDEKIVIPDHLQQCRLTVSFNNESIDEIVNVIAETLGLTLKKSGQRFVLEGKACEK
ncbi:MAG: FecR family protein [Bacteroidota bacterium]